MSSRRNNFYIQRTIIKRTDIGTTVGTHKRCAVIAYYTYITVVAILLFLFEACSPQRNTATTRAYHELTTRYNIYFNAEEAYHEILQEQSENFSEDYTKLIPFYPGSLNKKKTTDSGPFDPVIDKTEKAIRKHSISSKPRRDPNKAHSQEYRQWLRQEEFNPFLKNVWLLRGKAFLQNGDYDEALSVFSGIMRLYSYESALVDASEIWMLRTYTDMENWYDAEKTAYSLRNKKLSGNLEKLFTEHFTYFLIQNKRYQEAISYLRKIITQETDHIRKKRWQFLLGQLYVLTGDIENAYHAFNQVKGLRTPTELSINANRWQTALKNDTSAITRNLMLTEKMNDASGLINEKEINSKEGTIFSQGRTMAENAALHRQWRLQNGLWRTRAEDFVQTKEGHTQNKEGLAQSKEKLTQTIEGLAQTGEQISPFTPGKSGKHYLLLIFSPDSTNKNQLLFAASNYNFSNYQLRKFNITSIWMPTVEALQIEPFYSFEEATRYTNLLHSDSHFRTAAIGTTPIIISEVNLKLFLSGNRIDEYIAYFAAHIAPEENIVLEESIVLEETSILPVKSEKHDELGIIEENKGAESEKIVSLSEEENQLLFPIPERQDLLVQPNTIHATGKETVEMMKQRLEQNASKAQQQQQITAPQKSRKELLKERDQLRKEKIRQRERELKDRARKRDAELKQREKERALKIRKQQ